jgi:predicted ATPase
MILTLAIANYRSLRELVIPLGQLTLITGANGAGKSSVYRSLRLLAQTAQGGIIPTLALEGGLPSTLWAGPEKFGRKVLSGEYGVEGTVRSNPVQLRLGFATEDFGYLIDLGLPPPIPASAFHLDPEIKREVLFAGEQARPSSMLVGRRGPAVRVRDEAGKWQDLPIRLAPFESLMTHCADPRATPELLSLRERIRAWRFYDHFRTDASAPARQVQIGTRTPVLAHDGADLAAAIQTIVEIGDQDGFAAAIDDAFPGSAIEISSERGYFALQMHQHGLLRPLGPAELSDGTLRYLLLATALMSPRPPELLILNEPETSLHPELLPALARLIINASRRSQVLVVSHAQALIAVLEAEASCSSIELEKRLGETHIRGAGLFDGPGWTWPER